jgi:TonB family protein
MQIPRQSALSRSLVINIVALAFGGILLAQDTPDRPSDKTAEQSAETVYKVGKDGVTAPRATYAPPAEFSDQARQAKYQGTVVLMATVSSSGKVTDVRIVSALGMGLDEKAIEAVRRWKFKPATKDGKAVAVTVAVEVAFHL